MTRFVIFIGIIITITSCQQTLIKKQIKSAEVDSSLYFKQIEVHDPFLDKLKSNSAQSFTLKKKIIPPPQEIPLYSRYKKIKGFRVQVYAGVDLENALANKNIAKSTVTDTIYQFDEKGLIKLQVGDYPYYPQADSVKRIFRQTHFPGAWIVKTNIFVSDSDAESDTLINSVKNDKAMGMYKIQVIVTSDKNKAQNIVDELNTNYNNKAYTESNEGVEIKVFVGDFKSETEAREVLKNIRQNHFPDAWLVY